MACEIIGFERTRYDFSSSGGSITEGFKIHCVEPIESGLSPSEGFRCVSYFVSDNKLHGYVPVLHDHCMFSTYTQNNKKRVSDFAVIK